MNSKAGHPVSQGPSGRKAPVLVTGGAGSLGRRVVARLLAEGRLVRVLDLPDLDYTGLDGAPGIEVLRGDITSSDDDLLREAAAGVDAVVHLAALLPPASEANRDRTFAVNVAGVERLAAAMQRAAPDARLVFSSSVTTYGDTSGIEAPVGPEHSQQALDIYAESKIAAEEILRRISPRAVLLRISGIAVPAFQEPPDPWPFTADQRIEFVHREDVVSALCAATTVAGAAGAVFNIAGGQTWRTTGRAYVKDYFDLLGVPIAEARFRTRPGPFGWYDTALSQRVFRHQTTPYRTYLRQVAAAVSAMMAGPG